ncbi:hypothetical protein HMPREF9318_01352 [Streptococcus urinalis FB127-CNA-2]|uniref:LytTr DNA-binding domain protein n=1 Tax=Streptococcus urinalis 2285-97 TaxID=764291 RepID=G5KCT2_9STRE|nr:LytTr DNA-binding domain protein [Streptococcus urinalis 2285-97]EKS19276.1 hypothetical protein HMPREF9318_01352 [Streptococcus urinalis FB127-CNA-2]VEF31407.1 response regulator [Streptococcus urinalis]
MKGLEVAKFIRQKDPHAIIIFVTTHSEFMPLTFQYQVSALDFIDKTGSDKEIKARLEAAIDYAQDKLDYPEQDSFLYKSNHTQVQVPFKDILFFETSPSVHKVILYTERDRVEFYAKISEIAKLDKRLFQCHRSFVLNPAKIVRIDKENRIAYFRDGSFCLVSRMKMKGLIEVMEKLQCRH